MNISSPSTSILMDETRAIHHELVRTVQDHERRKFGVKVESRPFVKEEAPDSGPEFAAGQGMKEHPLLALTQRYDGDDPNVTPNPRANEVGPTEWENEQRDQNQEQLQKRLELGLVNAPRQPFRPTPGV